MRDSPAVARVQSLLREMFTIDLRTLALFRIAVGCILVADLLLRARFFSAITPKAVRRSPRSRRAHFSRYVG